MKIDPALKERLLEACGRMTEQERVRFEKLALAAYRKAVQVRRGQEPAEQAGFAEGLALAGAILHGDPDGLLEEASPGGVSRKDAKTPSAQRDEKKDVS